MATAWDVRAGMPHLAFVVFPNSSAAEDGTRALKLLHAKGDITLFGAARLLRKAGSRLVAVRAPMPARGASAAPSLGSALAGLIVVLGGCTAAAAMTAGMAIVSAVGDLAEAGLDADVLERIADEFRSGCVGLMAEVEEDSPFALYDRMEALHGRVLRQATPACREDAILRELELARTLDPSLRRFRLHDREHLLRKAFEAAEAMGYTAHDRSTIHRVIDIIVEGLPDLIMMPTEQPHALATKRRKIGVELAVKAHGQEIHSEVI